MFLYYYMFVIFKITLDTLPDFYVLQHPQLQNVQQLIDDEEKTIKPKDTAAEDFGWDNYYHLSTIYSWMDQIATQFVGVVEKFSIGNSWEGRPIEGVKISKKPGNVAIFVEAGIHAREWISPATATYIIDQLLTSTGELL
jgi:murein tripeptide amidase MpaA